MSADSHWCYLVAEISVRYYPIIQLAILRKSTKNLNADIQCLGLNSSRETIYTVAFLPYSALSGPSC
jgi:hypothetical protein